MERKIHKLLREMVERKSQPLNENIKIFKSNEVYDKTNGLGYWLYMASNELEGNDFRDETMEMGSALKLTKSQQHNFTKEHPGIGLPKYFKDPETGQFGWGYFISKLQEKDPTLIEKRLSWLKDLVRKYNISNKLNDDLEIGSLTLKQVKQIQNLVSDIDNATEMNPETKAKFEEYLNELMVSIENDDVFNFLTQKYNEAKKFINNNILAGTRKHPYSVTNSFIILAADPEAKLAAQKNFWKGRNYKIKDGVIGISIRRPRTGNTAQTAKGLLSKPGALDNYKQSSGIDPNMNFSQIMKSNPEKHGVDMAYSAIQQKAVRTSFSREETNEFGIVYTDTMVEPIPGKQVESIQDMIGISVDNSELFNIPQKELDSDGHRQKLNILFKALVGVTEDAQINTVGIHFQDGDINEFNKLLNALAFDISKGKILKSMRISASQITPEIEEILHGYSEAISNIVKKHYGLPSEESKYNVARQGVDKEEIEKVYAEIIRIANDIVNNLDKKIEVGSDYLNEIRKVIRGVLRNSL